MKEINGSLGIGGSPDVSTLLKVTSTTQGVLSMSMTTAQRNAISGPPSGLIVYNTTLKYFEYYDGAAWQPLSQNDYGAVVAAGNVTNSTNSLADVTGLVFSYGANEVWNFEFLLGVSCNNTGGIDVGINMSSFSSLVASAVGVGSSSTARTFVSFTANNTATTTAFHTFNHTSSPYHLRIYGTATAGGSAGTCQLRFRSHTNGQTSTIWANSFMRARRVA
jgi:hypothetical protein